MCFMLLSLGGGYTNSMLSCITQKAANAIKKIHNISESKVGVNICGREN